MGSAKYHTQDTAVYYPSDWLIEGGPPFETAGCKDVLTDESVRDIPLEIIYNPKTKYFGLVYTAFLVMESKDPKEIAKYVLEYTQAFKVWVQSQEAQESKK